MRERSIELLPGQYFDRETGLFYNLNRDYNSGIGTYIEAEPLGLAGDINLYRYARNNPLTYFDPDGMQATTAGSLGGRVLGGALGGGARGAIGGGIAGIIIGAGIGALAPMCQVTDRDRCERACDAEYDRGRDFCRAMSGMRGRNKAAFQACMKQVDEQYIACYQDCARQ